MKHTLSTILNTLPPELNSELQTLAEMSGQPKETVLENLLNQSSHSLAALNRMSEYRFRQWLESTETLTELGRIFWKALWVSKPSVA